MQIDRFQHPFMKIWILMVWILLLLGFSLEARAQTVCPSGATMVTSSGTMAMPAGTNICVAGAGVNVTFSSGSSSRSIYVYDGASLTIGSILLTDLYIEVDTGSSATVNASNATDITGLVRGGTLNTSGLGNTTCNTIYVLSGGSYIHNKTGGGNFSNLGIYNLGTVNYSLTANLNTSDTELLNSGSGTLNFSIPSQLTTSALRTSSVNMAGSSLAAQATFTIQNDLSQYSYFSCSGQASGIAAAALFKASVIPTDYSDAPASFGSPLHEISGSLQLGVNAPDGDTAAQPDITATGDDTTGTDDEDGISSFPWLAPAATSYSIPAANISATGTGTLHAWIDFNKNGAFTSSEYKSVAVTNGVLAGPLNWTGITVGAVGTTYARFRFTSTTLTDSLATSTVDERATLAAFDGEVEDYAVTIAVPYDLSDAPVSYGAPSHVISGSLKLGANAPDIDTTLAPLDGTGDDVIGTDDEDGIISFPPLAVGAANYSIPTANISATGTGTLRAWIDFDKNGAFTSGEHTSVAVTAGVLAGPLNWTGITVGTTGASYARFRFTSIALADVAVTTEVDERATASATNGEVEDYAVTIMDLADLSDAPSSYGAPSHVLSGSLKLGINAPDADTTLTPLDSTGDDTTDTDDEDGVSSFPSLMVGTTSYFISASNISATGTGTLHAWVDFNQDGVFSDSEYDSVAVTSGTLAGSLSWNGITVSSTNTTYARFRFTSTALTDNVGTTSIDERATAAAADGEVEDYAITPETMVIPSGYCRTETLVASGNFTTDPVPVSTGWSYAVAPFDTPIIGGAYNYPTETSSYHNSTLTGGLYDDFNPAGNPATGIYSALQESDGPTAAVVYKFPHPLLVGQHYYSFDLSSRFNHTLFADQYKVSLYNADTDQIVTVLQQDFVDTLPAALVETPKWKNFSGTFNITTSANYFLLFQIDQNLGTQNADYMIDRVAVVAENCPELDFSDAPASYGAPSHFIAGSQKLGVNAPDSEATLTPLDGTSDDATGIDDEDGISVFPTLLAGTTSYSIPAANISATGSGTLHAWIDFNQNGAFTSGEYRAVTVTNGVLSGPLNWTGLTISSMGTTYARFRFTSTVLTDNAGTTTVDERAIMEAANGEVEDYPITITGLDYADAPATYGSPSHIIFAALKLGANAPDNENSAQPNASATGDDAANTDDEDGISFGTLTAGGSTTITATVAGSGGKLSAWFDWNRDGDFADAGEQVATDIADNGVGDTDSTVGSIVFNLSVPIRVAATGFVQSYARFRWSTASGLTAINAAPDGEVEDYQVTINGFASPTTCSAHGMDIIGNAYINANNEYVLTNDTATQSGALWSKQRIDLNQPFDFQIGVYLGINDYIGADGITFTLQNDPRAGAAQGFYGGYMGVDSYAGGPNPVAPSIVVEFDTWHNVESVNDIGNDHTGIYLNGDAYQSNPANILLDAISIGTGGNIEDGAYHLTRYVWSPSTQTFQYYFDGVLLGSFNRDLISFFGSPYILFGFTGSTGGYSNLQKACIAAPGIPLVDLPADYADAPASYGTPSHAIAGSLKLGATAPDSEVAAQPNATATGDDTAGSDDEDGVSSFPTLTVGATSYTIPTANISATGTGTLHAWIDFNQDGAFSASEYKSVAVTSGTLAGALNWSGITVGASGTTYARFRFTSDTLTDTVATTAVDERATVSAADGEVEDYALPIDNSGYTLSGRVFHDANVNASDDTEVGLKNVGIVLYDHTANTCEVTRTGANGGYQFSGLLAGDYTVYEAATETAANLSACPPAARDPNGYHSTTPNSQTVTITNAAVNNIDFGDVQAPHFSLDHEKVILPNTSVTYPHIFQSKVDGSVVFSVVDEYTDPNNLVWGLSLHLDSNCDAKLNQGDLALDSTSAYVVNAGDQLCVLVKVLAPANAPQGASHSLTMQSEFTYGLGGTGIANDLQTHTDLTRTSAGTTTSPVDGTGKLALTKAVWNVTRNIDGAVAKPGETLRYTLFYENIGNGLLNELEVYDTVPSFTSVVNGSMVCVTTPPELTSCTPTINGTNLVWTFGGQLKAGSQGSVSYEVTVD